MKLTFEKSDFELVKMALRKRGIWENHPNFDDFYSNALYQIARVMHKYPDYDVTSEAGLKQTIIKRAILVTIKKLASKQRKHVLSEWRGTEVAYAQASVPSTVDAMIDARRTYELLSPRSQRLVQSRMMGDSDAEYARKNGVSKQGVSQSIRRNVKRLKKVAKS